MKIYHVKYTVLSVLAAFG